MANRVTLYWVICLYSTSLSINHLTSWDLETWKNLHWVADNFQFPFSVAKSCHFNLEGVCVSESVEIRKKKPENLFESFSFVQLDLLIISALKNYSPQAGQLYVALTVLYLTKEYVNVCILIMSFLFGGIATLVTQEIYIYVYLSVWLKFLYAGIVVCLLHISKTGSCWNFQV